MLRIALGAVAAAALGFAFAGGCRAHPEPPPPAKGEASAAALPNKFFAFCMDTHDSKKRGLAEQARLLAELGYDGAGHLWLDQVPERLATLDAAGLALFQIYIRLDLDPAAPRPYDPRLEDVLPLLRGRPTMLAGSGVRIALYHHAGDWLARVEDAIRVADKVDRPDVGVMFNLCHWLRTDKSRDYAPLIARAGKRLFAVSINGADERDPQEGWQRYLQILGRGSFDTRAFLAALLRSGFTGPIGLQCYGIEGDARDTLTASMEAWRRYAADIAAAKRAADL